jgi:UPF0716 protein FxsA
VCYKKKRSVWVLARVVIALFILAVAELTTLLWLASRVGWAFALAEVMITLAIGLAVIRWESVYGWVRRLEKADRAAALLAQPLDTMLLFLGGMLLMTPGLITDCAGFLLLFPPTRILLRSIFLRSFGRGFLEQSPGNDSESFDSTAEQSKSEEVIDVEFYRIS